MNISLFCFPLKLETLKLNREKIECYLQPVDEGQDVRMSKRFYSLE